MNIMENKRVTIIAAAMGLAFLGLCYYGYDRYSAFKDAQQKIEGLSSEAEAFADEAVVPTKVNSQAMIEASKEAKELSVKLTDEMAHYATTCMRMVGAAGDDNKPVNGLYAPITSATGFQKTLKGDLGAKIVQYAKDKCALGEAAKGSEDSVRLHGLARFDKSAPTDVEVPYYSFLLYAIDGTMRHIIDAGATAIKKIYCRPLPEGNVLKDKYFRLGYEVVFSAKRSEVIDPQNPDSLSVLPQVINKLSHDENFYYIITGMAVKSPDDNNQPEARIEMLAGEPATTEGGEAAEPAGEAEEGAAAQETVKIAKPLLGNPDDTVDVFMNIQVLYFTTDKL